MGKPATEHRTPAGSTCRGYRAGKATVITASHWVVGLGSGVCLALRSVGARGRTETPVTGAGGKETPGRVWGLEHHSTSSHRKAEEERASAAGAWRHGEPVGTAQRRTGFPDRQEANGATQPLIPLCFLCRENSCLTRDVKARMCFYQEKVLHSLSVCS